MSDSVDRVFVHALNTVKKIPRTGTARPPAAERLKLYGLYKQSMEGDVEGIMDRPIGDTPDVQAEREKWDAWYSQRGSSRTEAKGRYITTLINTMHLYASQTAEARELVAELEFVWDQIKYNNNASSSSSSPSSPMRTTTTNPPITPDIPAPRRYGSINNRMARSLPNVGQDEEEEDEDQDLAIYRRRSGDSRLRVLSPVSQSDVADIPASSHPDNDEEEEVENEQVEDEDEDEDEFQEARDGTSFSEETTSSQDHNHHDHNNNNNNSDNRTRRKRRRPSTQTPKDKEKDKKDGPNGNIDWRRRVEQALTKMTTEIAALREQIESRPTMHTRRRPSSIWSWLKWLLSNTIRQLLWQCAFLSAILLWMRLVKGDKTLERKLLDMFVNFKNRLLLLLITRRRRMPRNVLSQTSLP